MTMKKRIFTILIVLVFLYGCTPKLETEDPANDIKPGLDPADIMPGSEEFMLCADNEYLSLFVQTNSGAFYVLDKRNQTKWYSNPPGVEDNEDLKGLRKTNLQSQLLLSYVGKEDNEEISNSQAGSKIKYGIKVAERENGFRASYEFPDVQITVIVDVILDGDRVTVNIPREQIIEAGDYKLFSLTPYPFFGAGGTDDKGYVLVPDGSGALIYFNNKKQSLPEYKQRLYGPDPSFSVMRQSAVTEQAFLPVFGVKKNDAGFIAIAEKGAEYATCRAYVSGQNGPYNGGYFDFQLRYSYQYSLDGINDIKLYDKKERVCGDISISYYILENDKSDYSGMAQRVKQYLVENGASYKDGTADIVLDIAGITTQRKYLLGFETRKTVVLTQYQQAAAMVEELKAYGMDNIIIQYSGAVADSYKGRVTRSLTPASALGGSKGWSALNSIDGIVAAPRISFTKYLRSGNGVSTFFDAARNLSNALARQLKYKLSTYYPDKEAQVGYLVSPGKLTSLGKRFSDKLDDSVTAISLGDMGAVLYSDYNKSGRYSRTDCLSSMIDIYELLDRDETVLLAEKANMYALKYVDHVLSVPVSSSRFSIVDCDVPFYQLVVSGLTGYSSPPVNLESNPETGLLKLLETGSVPQFTVYGNEDIDIIFTDTPEYLSCSFDSTRERIKQIWHEYSQALQELESSTIVSHRYLGDKVVQTIYTSGKSAIINYSSEHFSSPEANVPPMSYCILGGEK